MPRGKMHTYDLYRLTEGKKVKVAENVGSVNAVFILYVFAVQKM